MSFWAIYMALFGAFLHHDCLSSAHLWTSVPCPSTPLLTVPRGRNGPRLCRHGCAHTSQKKIHTLGKIWVWAWHCSLAWVHPGTSHHLQDLWCYEEFHPWTVVQSLCLMAISGVHLKTGLLWLTPDCVWPLATWIFPKLTSDINSWNPVFLGYLPGFADG